MSKLHRKPRKIVTYYFERISKGDCSNRKIRQENEKKIMKCNVHSTTVQLVANSKTQTSSYSFKYLSNFNWKMEFVLISRFWCVILLLVNYSNFIVSSVSSVTAVNSSI